MNNRLRNMVEVSGKTVKLGNECAKEIFGNSDQLNSAIGKNDQIRSKVRISDNFINGIFRNQVVDKLV